jgi:carboxypeptidase Taq
MTVFEAKEKLTALQRKMAAYEHAQSLLYYDGCTSAPKGSAGTRANSLSILSEESYKLYTGEETVQLMEFLDAHKDQVCTMRKGDDSRTAKKQRKQRRCR